MELKYYLRGLGLGITITAIIMGVFTSKSKAMTNEEIIARAKQLGMIENTVLTEMDSENDKDDAGSQDADALGKAVNDTEDIVPDKNSAGTPVSGDNAGNEDGIADNSNVDVSDSEAGGRTTDSEVEGRTTDSGIDVEAADPGEKVNGDNTADSGEEVNTDNTAVPGKSMVVTVGRGDGSYSVSRKLEDVGAVSSAGEFDTFLCENGYDKKIRAGTYTIPANASEEQMARIITGAE